MKIKPDSQFAVRFFLLKLMGVLVFPEYLRNFAL